MYESVSQSVSQSAVVVETVSTSSICAISLVSVSLSVGPQDASYRTYAAAPRWDGSAGYHSHSSMAMGLLLCTRGELR